MDTIGYTRRPGSDIVHMIVSATARVRAFDMYTVKTVCGQEFRTFVTLCPKRFPGEVVCKKCQRKAE
jgi:hypothetical protein